MPNLYGASNQGSRLYGAEDSLSMRNQAQAFQLGIPEAVGGRGEAGSQIEANDPYANFEDIFNLNRSKGAEMAQAAKDKVSETAGVRRIPPRNYTTPAPQTVAGPQERTGTVQEGTPTKSIQMPRQSLVQLQATSDNTNPGASMLGGFGETVSQSYEDKADNKPGPRDVPVEEKPAVAPAAPPAVTATPAAPAPTTARAAPEATTPTPQTDEDRTKAALAANNPNATPEELQKLDQIRAANDLLKGYGGYTDEEGNRVEGDQGQSILQDLYGPEASSWDAAIMNAAGGASAFSELQKSLGGKDVAYAKQLADTVNARRQERGALQDNLNRFAKTKANAAENAANAPEEEGPAAAGPKAPSFEDIVNFNADNHEDIVRTAGITSSPLDAIWEQIPGAGQGPMQKATDYLENQGMYGSESLGNDSRDVSAKRAITSFKNKFGEDAARTAWGMITGEMFAAWINEGYNEADIYRILEQMWTQFTQRSPT